MEGPNFRSLSTSTYDWANRLLESLHNYNIIHTLPTLKIPPKELIMITIACFTYSLCS